MVVPKPVYEALPYSYLVLAMACFMMMDHWIRFLSAMIFLVLGVVIISWRRQYRAENRTVQKRIENRRIRRKIRRISSSLR